MSPIKDLNISVDAVNEEQTFFNGDPVAGTVTLSLKKSTKIKSFVVKLKGDANVRWTQGTGDNKKTYSAHRRFFKIKHDIIAEGANETELPQGIHVFKFRLTIPQEDMPSSFRALHGKIVYLVEAKVSRSWHLPDTVSSEITFVSNSYPRVGNTTPQVASVDKALGLFSKKQVHMSATINRKCCSPGETLSVVANINNSSSKEMKPKFCLHQKIVYSANTSKKTSDLSVYKVAGDTISPKTDKQVSCQFEVPRGTSCTLHNCDILSVTYYVKVYLDISFSFDPEVVFPLVILPPSFAAHFNDGNLGPYPFQASGAPNYSDFSSAAFPPPGTSGAGAYGYPAPGPAQYMNISGGYASQFTQPTAPYEFENTAFYPPPVQHQTPSAPPMFQSEEEPPSYTSLFPTTENNQSSSKF